MAKQKIVFKTSEDINSEKLISPYEYFAKLKDKVQTMDSEKLSIVYNNALTLAEKFQATGQKTGLKKLVFHIESIMKESQVIEQGITKFIYKDDIEDYIQNVSNKQVVIVDIGHYEKNIPDDVVEKMMKVKDLFNEFYVVCTDYNRQISKAVQKERREKDPILFGVFLDRNKQAINERFYYIGDWVDDYCDLTLDKMVSEMERLKGINIEHTMSLPQTQEELKKQMDSLKLIEEPTSKVTGITLVSSDLDLVKKEKQKKKKWFNWGKK